MTQATPYRAVWPGQPGGYVPVLAEQMLKEPGVQLRAAAWRAGIAADPTAPPKPTTAQHLHGISVAANASIKRYRANGLALEAKHKAIEQGRQAARAKAKAKPKAKTTKAPHTLTD